MLNLIPYPHQVEEQGGVCRIPDKVSVLAEKEFSTAIKVFGERIADYQLELTKGNFLTVIKDAEITNPEQYNLLVTQDNIVLKASDYNGAFYGLVTLLQLMQKDVEGIYVPCVTISDKPTLAHRALHLDCSRHFFEAEEVKKIIEAISLSKLNVLHWHLSDDQGWRIESKKFPLLQQNSGRYYSQEEIKQIVAYAEERGVEVVPEIDMPGHVSAILNAYPQYGCFGKVPKIRVGGGIFPIIFCAGKASTMTFIKELLDEIILLFPSKRFHIGGDEAPRVEWKTCPDCQAKMQALGIDNLDDLQGAFTAELVAFLELRGKVAICWSDLLKAKNFPHNIQLQYWNLQKKNETEAFMNEGGKVIYSDMFEYYLDYPHSMTNLKRLYENEPHFSKRKAFDKLYGLEGCIWTEWVAENQKLEERVFPRINALAERAWGIKRPYEDFAERLTAYQSAPWNKVKFTDSDWWVPTGKARRDEAILYFTSMSAGQEKDEQQATLEASAPNAEFASSFINKFFKFGDLPALLSALMKQK